MTDQTLTEPAYRAIIGGDIGLKMCSDGMLAWFYHDKSGRRRREVLFRVDGTYLLYQDPATKEEYAIGTVLHLAEGPLIVVFTISK
jgi:hypothetical protein